MSPLLWSSCAGDDQADTLQSMSTLLTAQEVQQQVQGNTQQALEWLAQSQPQHADSSSAPASMQHEGLCKLSLLPVDVMEMATVQLAPGRHCLVSHLTSLHGVVSQQHSLMCITGHLICSASVT